jgi:flap endonuclease-1
MIQNLSKSLSRKIRGRWVYEKIQPQLIDLRKTLRELKISYFQLVDMGLLIGNDYFPGIPKIGPMTAWKLINVYQTIEQVKKNMFEKYDFSKLTPNLIKAVRKIFLFPEVLRDNSGLTWRIPHEPSVINLMCEDHSLDESKVRNNLERTITNYHKTIRYSSTNLNKPRIVQKSLF